MQVLLEKSRTTLLALPLRAKIGLAGVLIATAVVMILVIRAATATEWQQVTESGMSADRLGQAQIALENGAFKVRQNADGSALEVPKEVASKATAELMSAGIAATGGRTTCADMFGKGGSLGVSDTSKTTAVKLETCQEGQTANAIEQLDGVKRASVDVTLPESSLFTKEDQPAKASVVLDTGGVALPAKSVKGIRETVAARFKGLSASAVSIIDETGRSIVDSEEESTSIQAKKLEIESKFNALTEQKLTKQFEQIVGEGNVAVISNVELDLDAITRQVLENSTPDGAGQPVVELEDYEKELLKGAGQPGAQGVAGTGSNVGIDPDNRTTTTDGAAANSDNGDYVKDRGSNTYAVNKVREDIETAPGTVIRNRISVTVDDKVDEAAANAINNSVQAWMGGDSQDSMTFNIAPLASALAIGEDQAATTGGVSEAIADYLKWILLGLGLIAVAFVLRRRLNQRMKELMAPRDEILLDPGDISPIPIDQLEAAISVGSPLPNRGNRFELQRKIEHMADVNPEEVANELRRWMKAEDMTYGSKR